MKQIDLIILFIKRYLQNKYQIKLDLNKIKFKLDVKNLSLFLETKKTKVSYREVTIPAENIKVYINFVSLLKSSPKITKINFFLEEIEIDQLKKNIHNFKTIQFYQFNK